MATNHYTWGNYIKKYVLKLAGLEIKLTNRPVTKEQSSVNKYQKKTHTLKRTCQIFQTGNSNIAVLSNDIPPECVHFHRSTGLAVSVDEERAPEIRQQVINFCIRDQGTVLNKSGKQMLRCSST